MMFTVSWSDFKQDFKRQPLLIGLMFVMLFGFPIFVRLSIQYSIDEISKINSWEHRKTQIISKLYAKKAWLSGEAPHMQAYVDAGSASYFQKRRLKQNKEEMRDVNDLIQVVTKTSYPQPLEHIEELIPRGGH